MKPLPILLLSTLLLLAACDEGSTGLDVREHPRLFHSFEINGQPVPRVLELGEECVTLLMPSQIALRSDGMFAGRIDQILTTCTDGRRDWTFLDISGRYEQSGNVIRFSGTAGVSGVFEATVVDADRFTTQISGTRYLFVDEQLLEDD